MSEFDHRAFAAPELPGLDPEPFITFHPPSLALPPRPVEPEPPLSGERTAAGVKATPNEPAPAAVFSILESGEGGSVQLVLRKRAEQLALGHTIERDLQAPIGFLANQAQRYLTDARDWLDRGQAHDPARAHFELKLVNAGALILAELDRLYAKRALG